MPAVGAIEEANAHAELRMADAETQLAGRWRTTSGRQVMRPHRFDAGYCM